MAKTVIKCYICKIFFDADKTKWRFYRGKAICADCIKKILDK